MQKEKREFKDAATASNCPVVAGYPDVAGLNVDGLSSPGVHYIHSFFSLDAPGRIVEQVVKAFDRYGISVPRPQRQ